MRADKQLGDKHSHSSVSNRPQTDDCSQSVGKVRRVLFFLGCREGCGAAPLVSVMQVVTLGLQSADNVCIGS